MDEIRKAIAATTQVCTDKVKKVIGYGPPDVSRCGSCGGSGLRRQERDWGDLADEAYERARDRRLERDW